MIPPFWIITFNFPKNLCDQLPNKICLPFWIIKSYRVQTGLTSLTVQCSNFRNAVVIRIAESISRINIFYYFFQAGTVTNRTIWLVLRAVRIFLSLTTGIVTLAWVFFSGLLQGVFFPSTSCIFVFTIATVFARDSRQQYRSMHKCNSMLNTLSSIANQTMALPLAMRF